MAGGSATTYFSRQLSSWMEKRMPAQREIHFDNHNLYIFPTRAGFAFLILIALLWIVSTNYENNLVFAFACLLSSVFLTTILHTFANLSDLSIHWVRAEPVFAGQSLVVELQILQNKLRLRQSIVVRFPDSEMVTLNLDQVEMVSFRLPVSAMRRGWLQPGRLRIESRYPLGLLRVWSFPDLDVRGLIYPRPIDSKTGLNSGYSGGEGQPLSGEGNEDFAGLRRYRPGESMQRISWKHYARERGILSKHYVDLGEKQIWVDWQNYPGLDRESRLSHMCGRLLSLHKLPVEFGMRLPGAEFPPDSGETHLAGLLRELALFELEESP